MKSRWNVREILSADTDTLGCVMVIGLAVVLAVTMIVTLVLR